MRLATFTHQGSTRLGAIVGAGVVDLAHVDPRLPRDMIEFLTQGDEALRRASAAAEQTEAVIALEQVRLEAPVSRPRKFLGIGANYARESGPGLTRQNLADIRARGDQIWFNKQVSCISGPFDAIRLPEGVRVIHEAELALVIGKRCRKIARQHAAEAIAGYLICNDVTVADWAMRSPTVTLAKSYDTHGPIGPWIVTPDELPDPQSLTIQTRINGVVKERGNTADMAFACADLVSYLSRFLTLEPGDVLTTGTPVRPADFLKPGDVVRCEIEGIGYIENTVVRDLD